MLKHAADASRWKGCYVGAMPKLLQPLLSSPRRHRSRRHHTTNTSMQPNGMVAAASCGGTKMVVAALAGVAYAHRRAFITPHTACTATHVTRGMAAPPPSPRGVACAAQFAVKVVVTVAPRQRLRMLYSRRTPP